jgi:hypothetical protein
VVAMISGPTEVVIGVPFGHGVLRSIAAHVYKCERLAHWALVLFISAKAAFPLSSARG